MTTPEPSPAASPASPAPPEPTVWPATQAHDPRALIDFLVDALGFVEVAAYEDDGVIVHAQLAWPEGGGVMLGSYKPDGPWARPPGSAGSYVVTDHVEDVHARAVAHGATIAMPLTDQDYGNREFAVADPEGNLWSFGAYRGEPVPTAS